MKRKTRMTLKIHRKLVKHKGAANWKISARAPWEKKVCVTREKKIWTQQKKIISPGAVKIFPHRRGKFLCEKNFHTGAVKNFRTQAGKNIRTTAEGEICKIWRGRWYLQVVQLSNWEHGTEKILRGRKKFTSSEKFYKFFDWHHKFRKVLEIIRFRVFREEAQLRGLTK